MACNRLPDAYPSLLVHITVAQHGAVELGAELPLLINTAPLIAADRLALIETQTAHRVARSTMAPLYKARRAAVKSAYDFCLTARDVIQFHLGREWNGLWIAAGWEHGKLSIPQGYDALYDLTLTLIGYLAARPGQEVPSLHVTSVWAQAVHNELSVAQRAVIDAEADAMVKRNACDVAWTAARRRLCDLNKELSMRLGPLDARWLLFGFNMPGAAEAPRVPEEVVVTPLVGARFQVRCAPVPRATRYRYYVQRPVLDPVPVPVGGTAEPLFVTPALEPGTEYLVYVSAANQGAESGLSAPVTARTGAAMAA